MVWRRASKHECPTRAKAGIAPPGQWAAGQSPIKQGHIWAEPGQTEEQRHRLEVQKCISQTKSLVGLGLGCTHEEGQPAVLFT